MFLDRNDSLFLNSKDFLFSQVFSYWKNTLFEYCTRLFNVDGLPHEFMERQFKAILLLDGKLGATNDTDGNFAFGRASLYGVTHYIDEYPSMLVNLVTEVIDCVDFREKKNAVLVRNNALMNGLRQKIWLYATLLAHCDLTIKVGTVNQRDSRLYEAITEGNKQGIEEFLRKREMGKQSALVNTGFSLVRIDEPSTGSKLQLTDVLELRSRLLSQFLEDIGVRRRDTKKERLITDEVQADTELLALNLVDMYDYWKKGAQEINDLWGFNIEISSNVNLEKGGAMND